MNTHPYPIIDEGEQISPRRLNPYDPTIQDAQELASRLELAAQRLANAIPAKRETSLVLQEAEKDLEAAQAMLIMQEEMAGANGAFAGIAKTSKTYGYAVDQLLGGDKGKQAMQAELKAVANATTAHEQASVEYEQAEVLYNALKYVAGLKAAILTASRG